jgi:hypothetical protein
MQQLEVMRVAEEREIPCVVGTSLGAESQVMWRTTSMRTTRHDALEAVSYRDGFTVLDLVQPQRQISH